MTKYAVKARKRVSKLSAVEEMLSQALAAGETMGKTIGKTEGLSEARNNIALALISLGQIALEDIAKVCNLTLQQVQNLAANVNP